MNDKEHWETVYTRKAPEEVSWFQPEAELSLRLIDDIGLPRSARMIDVGGGASTLVDGLLERGFSSVTVLDLSGAALQAARHRLGPDARRVTWIEADVTTVALEDHSYDVWHDRAVFHFLTEPVDRNAYVAQVRRSVRPGGHVIVASFAEDGPEKCSGLPVMRYSPGALHGAFGSSFELIGQQRETHHTPSGASQSFVYCYCRVLD